MRIDSKKKKYINTKREYICVCVYACIVFSI